MIFQSFIDFLIFWININFEIGALGPVHPAVNERLTVGPGPTCQQVKPLFIGVHPAKKNSGV